MSIKDAMKIYFSRLYHTYVKTFNVPPSVSWSSEINPKLFISTPDEDGEAQWRPILAENISMPDLCDELCQFYSSYYYCSLNGKYDNTLFYFEPIDSIDTAIKCANKSIKDGEYYFKKQNVLLLATCSKNGNDDYLLFYRQNNGEIFLYDRDKRFVYPLGYSLTELISNMEALI